MKKSIIALALALTSTSALAGYNSYYGKDESKLEVSFAQYQLDILGHTESANGAFLNYTYKNSRTGLGYKNSIEGFRKYDTNVGLIQIGMDYDLPLKMKYLSISPEIGMFHARIGDSIDSSYYLGMNVKADIIPEKFEGTFYYKKFDFTYDQFWETDNYGVDFTYKVSKDMSIDFGWSDGGQLSRLTLGMGFYF